MSFTDLNLVTICQISSIITRRAPLQCSSLVSILVLLIYTRTPTLLNTHSKSTPSIPFSCQSPPFFHKLYNMQIKLVLVSFRKMHIFHYYASLYASLCTIRYYYALLCIVMYRYALLWIIIMYYYALLCIIWNCLPSR